MKKIKICLFTAHSLNSGGGSVILKSLIEHLSEVDIVWYYTAERPVPGYENGYLGTGLMGGNIVFDVIRTWWLLKKNSLATIDHLVSKLLNIDCDGYWIVSHNEGMRVGYELAMSEKNNKYVHLTVHDDWAGAICARSNRYRKFSKIANKLTIDTLKNVDSFDVVSKGMKEYYENIIGISGLVCHRYLPIDTINWNEETQNMNSNEINVGHIGSIYNINDFFNFLFLLKEYGILKGLTPKVHLWGSHLKLSDFPTDLHSQLVFNPNVKENDAIRLLEKCNIVYAMYPCKSELKIFSKTSLPTKLTSYVQSSRPIFGHSPDGSTLDEFLSNTNTGVNWNSIDRDKGFDALESTLNMRISKEKWLQAREQYFGEQNITTLANIWSFENLNNRNQTQKSK